MALLWSTLTLLPLVFLLQKAGASHYRGGIIMMRPTNPLADDKEMEIFWRVSWRRDSGEGGMCDQSVIRAGTWLGYDDIVCQAGCTATVSPATYQCTDFSITDNWSFGERRNVFNFSETDETVTIGFTSCCWVIANDMQTATTMSLVKRNDTGRINSTPRALTALNLRLLSGCNHTIVIPVTDPDYDIVRCRWAVGYQECGDVCNAFPGAVLDEAKCTLSYQAANGPGRFAVALMVEDFLPGSGTPLSSVALQFMVEVFSSDENCSSVPEFIPPTLPAGSCVAIPPGGTFNEQLFIYSGYPGARVIEVNTVSPAGLTKSAIYPTTDPDVFYINITWTPDPSQYDEIHAFCFTAINSVGLSSEQNCIQLSAGDYPPHIIQSSLLPYNYEILPSGNIVLHLEWSKPVQRPLKDAKMYIKDYTTGAVLYEINSFVSNETSIYNDSHMTVTPNFVFPQCTLFSIEFEQGFVIGYGCNLESEAVTDKDFWTFSTDCPSITTPKIKPLKTTPSSKSPPCRIRPPCKHDDDLPCDDDHDDDPPCDVDDIVVFPCEDDPCDKHDHKRSRQRLAPISIRSRPILKGENNYLVQNIML